MTPPRPLIEDLDALPFPSRELTQGYRLKYFRGTWRPMTALFTSRGCPFRCNFCAMWKLFGGRYRTRSPQSVVDELKTIEVPYVDIVDDNPFHDIRRSLELYRLIKENNIRKTYKAYARSDTIVKHPEIIEKWKEIGMELILIGFESFNEEGLKKINKSNSLRNNNEAIRIIQKNNVEIAAYFVVRPDFTLDDFSQLVDYVLKMNLTHPMFTILTPFPGTDFYNDHYYEFITHDYEVLDFFHSVLPTALPPQVFYREFANLYKKCYAPREGHHNPVFNTAIMQAIGSRIEQAYQDIENISPKSPSTSVPPQHELSTF